MLYCTHKILIHDKALDKCFGQVVFSACAQCWITILPFGFVLSIILVYLLSYVILLSKALTVDEKLKVDEVYLIFIPGVTFKAHRIILAACSKHFQDLFEAAPLCPSVLVILDGTSSANMSALLEFMYKGEVHVKHESLSSFLKAAECLQVHL